MSTPSEPDAKTESAASFVPLSVPCLRGNEWEYVRECLDTNWVSSVGSYVDRFERMTADCAGTRYAVATVNGTAALHVALLVAGVEPGDEVLTSTLTFIASANAVRYAGAWPVFIDAEADHWQMDPSLVEEFLKNQCEWRNGRLMNRQTGRRVRAIMPVHILGHPVDMDPIIELARRYELAVVEDAAEALGAKYKGKPIGSVGDLACFSFNGNKIITTGGGGMIVIDDPEIAHRSRHLTTQAKSDPTEYVHEEIGFNYRLPNVLAAIGCAQLECLPQYLTVKRKIVATYAAELSDTPGIGLAATAPWAESTYWMPTVTVDASQFGRTARCLRDFLAGHRIQTRPLWQPMHRSVAHRDCAALVTGVADRLYEDGLSLPSSVSLSDADQRRVIHMIHEASARRNLTGGASDAAA